MTITHIPDNLGAVPGRFAPTRVPLLHPRPALVPIIDANALLMMGCRMVREGLGSDLVTELAGTGRSDPYIAAHISAEIRRHLVKVARDSRVPPGEVARVLDQRILPSARVVDLEIRDHLTPGARQILRVEPELPKANQGDPDDVPTMALAEFLAPAIISHDSVFARFGFASAAAQWVPLAQDLLHMAGIEANTTDAAFLTELALRLLVGSVGAAVSQIVRHPWIALPALAAALWLCHRRGYLRGEFWREKASRIWELARPLVEKASDSLLEHDRIRSALVAVAAPPEPVAEQVAARRLVRCGDTMTPADLRDSLKLRGTQIPATHLERAMRGHRAFTREPGNRYTVGRPARLLELEGS